MAKAPSLDSKINALTRIVEKGFAALADDIAHRPMNSSVAIIVDNVLRDFRLEVSNRFDTIDGRFTSIATNSHRFAKISTNSRAKSKMLSAAARKSITPSNASRQSKSIW